jgi:hypothetical protein
MKKKPLIQLFIVDLLQRYEVEKITAGTYKENSETMPKSRWALYANLFKGFIRMG